MEIRNRANPREHGAVSSMQHLFCSIRGNAILDSHPDSPGCKFVKDRGGAFSKQLILRKPRRARRARMLCGIFSVISLQRSGVS